MILVICTQQMHTADNTKKQSSQNWWLDEGNLVPGMMVCIIGLVLHTLLLALFNPLAQSVEGWLFNWRVLGSSLVVELVIPYSNIQGNGTAR